MNEQVIDATASDRIADLGRQVLLGTALSRSDGEWLFSLDQSADILELLSWANRLRQRYRGNKIHLCSIVNVKAGGCSENCRFCAQSSSYETDAPRYSLVEREPIMVAAEEAKTNEVTALGIVAAWKGLTEGPVLDEVCQHIRELAQGGTVRADASLGIIKSQRIADRLKEAGLACYNHTRETSRRFFPQICTTHSYEDRVETIGYLKNAGIRICSGGIIGMGETREDRCELAFSLAELDVDLVPINFLNPIPGTPLASVPPLPPWEILKTIACFRFILPRKEIMIAGGRTVNLRDLQCLIFLAGASAMMVGNYLTTLNQPVEKDLQMIKDLGLEPSGNHHYFDEGSAHIPIIW